MPPACTQQTTTSAAHILNDPIKRFSKNSCVVAIAGFFFEEDVERSCLKTARFEEKSLDLITRSENAVHDVATNSSTGAEYGGVAHLLAELLAIFFELAIFSA